MAKLNPDYILWTDGSVLESSNGGLSCLSYSSYTKPNKKQCLSYNLTLCITKPGGRLYSPVDTEIGGIDSALDNILTNKSTYEHKRVIVATDSQSTLKAMDVGPKRHFRYLGIDTSPLWDKLWWITEFVEEVILHYVPSHVGLVGNEVADKMARSSRTI